MFDEEAEKKEEKEEEKVKTNDEIVVYLQKEWAQAAGAPRFKEMEEMEEMEDWTEVKRRRRERGERQKESEAILKITENGWPKLGEGMRKKEEITKEKEEITKTCIKQELAGLDKNYSKEEKEAVKTGWTEVKGSGWVRSKVGNLIIYNGI